MIVPNIPRKSCLGAAQMTTPSEAKHGLFLHQLTEEVEVAKPPVDEFSIHLWRGKGNNRKQKQG